MQVIKCNVSQTFVQEKLPWFACVPVCHCILVKKEKGTRRYEEGGYRVCDRVGEWVKRCPLTVTCSVRHLMTVDNSPLPFYQSQPSSLTGLCSYKEGSTQVCLCSEFRPVSKRSWTWVPVDNSRYVLCGRRKKERKKERKKKKEEEEEGLLVFSARRSTVT